MRSGLRCSGVGMAKGFEGNMLSQNEITRYGRQISIPDFGEEAQEKLKRSRVVIAGVGGLGCTSSTILTAAGVGHITLIDLTYA